MPALAAASALKGDTFTAPLSPLVVLQPPLAEMRYAAYNAFMDLRPAQGGDSFLPGFRVP
jgi:hypothetical protein